ncbi:MAG TPA: serine/threonine-protein kinase, partial [Kofleriaceae bacterium]|nr:serine/threonine-protein kinase [Kofleriaceae bacterium]
MKGGDTSKKALDETASMSPDERARRGLTPPTPPSGERPAAGAVDTPALGETLTAGAGSGSGGAPVSLDVAALPVDDTGRYELSGVHARGGLGRIVKARDHRLHRTVAIKELLQRTPSTEARFVREALITARLEHPGIVPVHEAGRWPSGDPYYSMKLVSGRTLKELIQTSPTLEARLALVPHVLAVAEAIAYAHSQRIIHRDIKPANVIVGDFGETVVVDWGLAKDLSGQLPEVGGGEVAAPAAPGTTAVGNIMGTPSYMSPEQARGEELDQRADVYSLGAMLYEVLVGEPPHTGDNAVQILDSALAGLPPPIERYQPHAPPDLVAIAKKAMARSREARYPTAVELAEDIRRFQTGQLVTARSYSRRHRVARWIGRHRGMVAVAGAAALALLAGGAYAFQRVVNEKNHALSERASARAAEREARQRSHELLFLQAWSSLSRDPTATLAALTDYPAGGPHAEQLGGLVDEALSLGVARHVVRLPAWAMGAGYDRDGRLVSVDLEGRVVRWDLPDRG